MTKHLVLLFLFSPIASYYLEYHNPKTPDYSLSPAFLELLQSLFHAPIFIESGTLVGQTVANALSYFDKLYSIELSSDLYKRAALRFKMEPKIKILYGSSDIVLTHLLRELPRTQRILFWLDGHYSGDLTACGNKETPVMEELEAIKEAGITDAVILVDDIRDFFRQARHYPTVSELKNMINSINPEYKFFIYGDMAIACLASDNIEVSPLINWMTELYLQIPVSSSEYADFKALQNLFLILPTLETFLKPTM